MAGSCQEQPAISILDLTCHRCKKRECEGEMLNRHFIWLKKDLEAVKENIADDSHCKIRGIRKAHQIITNPKKTNGARAYSSSVLHEIIAPNHLPFFKIFSNFIHFFPNFQIFCPFSKFLFLFSEKS